MKNILSCNGRVAVDDVMFPFPVASRIEVHSHVVKRKRVVGIHTLSDQQVDVTNTAAMTDPSLASHPRTLSLIERKQKQIGGIVKLLLETQPWFLTAGKHYCTLLLTLFV